MGLFKTSENQRQPISSMGLYGLYAPACITYTFPLLPALFFFLSKFDEDTKKQHQLTRSHVLNAGTGDGGGLPYGYGLWVHQLRASDCCFETNVNLQKQSLCLCAYYSIDPKADQSFVPRAQISA